MQKNVQFKTTPKVCPKIIKATILSAFVCRTGEKFSETFFFCKTHPDFLPTFRTISSALATFLEIIWKVYKKSELVPQKRLSLRIYHQ